MESSYRLHTPFFQLWTSYIVAGYYLYENPSANYLIH